MRKILTVIAVGLGLLLGAAMVVELLFGTWFSTEPLDRLDLVRNRQLTVSSGALYDGGGYFVYSRDRWGFRGRDTDPAQVTILTVGGGTTNQPYLSEDATWQAVMARELAATGHPVTVANAGIDNHGTADHLRAMTAWFPNVPGLRPRFVLFAVGIDDVAAAGRAPEPLPPPDRLDRLRRHSVLWRGAGKLAALFGARRPSVLHHKVDYATVHWTDVPAQPDWKAEGPYGLDAYKERLRALSRATHDMGAVPVFVTQARGDYKLVDGKVLGVVEDDGLSGVDQYRRLSAFNRATRQVCADEGLLCLDLAREVGFEPGDFYDYVHNTPQGSAKIGRWLAAKIAGLV